jgi:hypothetical protein
VQNQVLFFNIGRKKVHEFQQKIAEISRIEGFSVTYGLPGKIILPSRNDQQFVNIASIATKADFLRIDDRTYILVNEQGQNFGRHRGRVTAHLFHIDFACHKYV